MTQKLNFGEIWLADLSPKIGTGLGKLRPVLIIQNQILLEVKHPSTLVIPLTTNLMDDTEPLRVRIKAQNRLVKDSDLLIDQIYAIDNKRLSKGPLMICDKHFMRRVHKAILEILEAKIEDLTNS